MEFDPWIALVVFVAGLVFGTIVVTIIKKIFIDGDK